MTIIVHYLARFMGKLVRVGKYRIHRPAVSIEYITNPSSFNRPDTITTECDIRLPSGEIVHETRKSEGTGILLPDNMHIDRLKEQVREKYPNAVL